MASSATEKSSREPDRNQEANGRARDRGKHNDPVHASLAREIVLAEWQRRAEGWGSVVTEADYRERGPKIGEMFPNVRLPDQRGELVDLNQRRGHRRAIVAFNRSAVW